MADYRIDEGNEGFKEVAFLLHSVISASPFACLVPFSIGIMKPALRNFIFRGIFFVAFLP